MKNLLLAKINNELSNFSTEFKDDNVLSLSDNQKELPFLYFINDDTYKDVLLVSVAVDYSNAIRVAEAILLASKYTKLALSEPFYISKSGSTSFNEDAYKTWEFETSSKAIEDRVLH